MRARASSLPTAHRGVARRRRVVIVDRQDRARCGRASVLRYGVAAAGRKRRRRQSRAHLRLVSSRVCRRHCRRPSGLLPSPTRLVVAESYYARARAWRLLATRKTPPPPPTRLRRPASERHAPAKIANERRQRSPSTGASDVKPSAASIRSMVRALSASARGRARFKAPGFVVILSHHRLTTTTMAAAAAVAAATDNAASARALAYPLVRFTRRRLAKRREAS